MQQLPIECIALAIEHLDDDGDIETLLSLMLVSRAVSLEAAAVLYRNPFRFLMAENPLAQRRNPSDDTSHRRGSQGMALLRLLARCLPGQAQTPFLKKIFALESPAVSPTVQASVGTVKVCDESAIGRCGSSSGGSYIQGDHSPHHSGACKEHQYALLVDDAETTAIVEARTAGVDMERHAGRENCTLGRPSINYISFLEHYDWVLFAFQIHLAIDLFCPWRSIVDLHEDPAQRTATEADVADIHPGADGFLEYIDNATDHQEPFYLMMCATAKLVVTLRLEREMTWAVCQERMDALQSLKIPLRDIDRFQDLIVQRGGHLQSLSFAIPWDRPSMDKRPQTWDKIEPLLRSHIEHHPGVLKEVSARSLWATDMTDHPDLSQYYFQWYRLLPPCSPPPVEIGRNSLKRLLPRWNEADYSQVTVVDLPSSVIAKLGFNLVEAILPRCRSLRRLHAKLSANAFQWAVDELSESTLTTAAVGRPGHPNNHGGGDFHIAWSSSISSHKKLVIPKPLIPVPLSMLQCTVSIYDVQKILRDATWAFHSTLAMVDVQAMHETSFNAQLDLQPPVTFISNNMPASTSFEASVGSTLEEFTIGHNWKLDSLHALHLTAGVLLGHLKLDREFFEGCISMRDLKLRDRSLEYDATKVVPCRLSNKHKSAMRELRFLDLCGMPALMFNPRILRNVPHLRRLELGWPHNHEMYFVTPVQDDELGSDYEISVEASMDQEIEEEDVDEEDDEKSKGSLFSKRRGWTWDWYLPSLTYLHLSGDWALRCRLRLLAGCPLLEELHMSMDNRLRIARHVTVEGIHEAMALGRLRRQSSQVTESGQPQQDQQDQQQQQLLNDDSSVLLPHLRKLNIFGPWHFGPGAFELFFTVICPNILTMTIPSSKGFTAGQLLKVTSKMPNLLSVKFPWLFKDEDDPDNYGLELMEGHAWNSYQNHSGLGRGDQDVSNGTQRRVEYNTMGLVYMLLPPDERPDFVKARNPCW